MNETEVRKLIIHFHDNEVIRFERCRSNAIAVPIRDVIIVELARDWLARHPEPVSTPASPKRTMHLHVEYTDPDKNRDTAATGDITELGSAILSLIANAIHAELARRSGEGK